MYQERKRKIHGVVFFIFFFFIGSLPEHLVNYDRSKYLTPGCLKFACKLMHTLCNTYDESALVDSLLVAKHSPGKGSHKRDRALCQKVCTADKIIAYGAPESNPKPIMHSSCDD